MKVDIEELRQRIYDYFPRAGTTSDNLGYEINEALNELEELRRYRNNVRTTETENLRLTQDIARLREMYEQGVAERNGLRTDLARITQIKDNLIIAGNRIRDELIERTEPTSFKKWFKSLHPETIESITFTLRKKEN